MKHVLIITYQYPPCASSGVYRVIRFIKKLPENGWQPVILTVKPELYPPSVPVNKALKINSEGQNEIQVFKTSMFPGIEQISSFLNTKCRRTKSFDSLTTHEHSKTANKSKWQAIKDFITISLMIPDKQNRWLVHAVKEAVRIVKKQDIDLIYAHGGPWTALVAASLVKKISHLPLVIDFRDPWTDNPYDDLYSSLRAYANSVLERWCIVQSNFVIANTDALKNLLQRKYKRHSNKFITITNGFDEDDFRFLSQQFRSSVPVYVVHTGTLYSKRSPLPFLKQIANLIRKGEIQESQIRIILVGNINIDGIRNFLEENKISNIVKMPGLVSRDKALEYVFSADILLLLQQGTELQIPGKLFEYIRAGKPIFTICEEGATKDFVVNHKLGLVADAQDEQDIQYKFKQMFKAVLDGLNKEAGYDVNQENIKLFSAMALTKRLAAVFDRALAGDETHTSYCK